MSLTNFPHGLSSFGSPVIGNGLFPIAGKDGVAYFVDPANGSDSNTGLSLDKALATVSAAYAKTVDKQGDVIYLYNDGNTSGTSREDATITWAKDNTHLVGICAPSVVSQRARISPNSSNTSIVTPQLDVTGNGNYFANISLFEGTSEDSTASIGLQVSGNRNVFYNVAVMNMGDATNGHSGDEAGSAHLKLNGAEENVFERCYIGLDTAARSTTNANVELIGASARNYFKDCIFPAFADNAGVLFVKADGSGDIDRWTIFENCAFINAIASTATTMTEWGNVHGSAGGMILLRNCTLIGATDWEGATASGNTYIDGGTPSATVTGLAVAVADS